MSKLHRGLFSSLLPSHMLGQHKGRLHKAPRRKPMLRPALSAMGVERLEDRWALSAAPVLSYLGQAPDPAFEASSVSVGFQLNDKVEAGGGGFGIDPSAYAAQSTANGAFVAVANIVVNTTEGVMKTLDGLGNPLSITGVPILSGTQTVMGFAFNSFTLGANFTLTAIGDKPMAILTQGNISIEGQIDLRPQAAAEDNGLTDNSHVPGAGGGEGGRLDFSIGTSSLRGRAAAGAPSTSGGGFALGQHGGGGAGHGGMGGNGPSSPAWGGISYGDLLDGVIYGGSGGGAGSSFDGQKTPEGGDGGGGIELAALGTISVSGSILADGLDGEMPGFNVGGGGGGAGGGILIHGKDVVVTGTLSATGGDGANPTSGGGGGAGGRILIAEDVAGATALPKVLGATFTVTGGLPGSGAMAGEDGLAKADYAYSSVSAPETYSYYIDFGSNDIQLGTNADFTVVTAGGPGVDTVRTFSATRTFADNGAKPVIVRVADSSMSGNFTTGVAGVDYVQLTVSVDVDNVAPTAEASGPSLTFDDMPIQLIGSGSDVAGLADPLTYTWDLDGDSIFGEIGDDAANGNEVGTNPVFDPVGLSGDVTVTLRVDDGDGGVTYDAIEITVLNEGTQLIGGVLHVVGNDGACDLVLITQCGSDIYVYATFNDNNPAVFAAADVDLINVRTRGGHDVVVTTSNVYETMTIDGGSENDLLRGGSGLNTIFGRAGRDTLYGGSAVDRLFGGDGDDDLFGAGGSDVLVGGAGSDILDGGDGRDLLIGGCNEDRLHGGSNEDILIGGFTIHDNDPAALDSIMAVWNLPLSFNDRVVALTTGTGLLVAGTAVFDDDAADHIIGAAGRDLAFGDTSKNGDGVRDVLSLSSAQDTLIALN